MPTDLSTNALLLRSRYGKPSHAEALAQDEASNPQLILFRHPGYPDGTNILLSLPALDNGGVHHETARIACAILANSRWDGFFSATRTGPAVDVDLDDLLTLRNYYFRLPSSDQNEDAKYPVVPDFFSYLFPHDNLPPYWLSDSLCIAMATDQPREANFSSVVLNRDISCRITNHTLGTESAHLVPRTEELWFTQNSMFQYSAWGMRITPDDPRNVLLLRSDIHTLFDAQRFAIVPKKGVWVAHVLSGMAKDELASLYHNVQLQQLESIATEFLFARFAWTIFARSTFILPSIKRMLVVLRPGTVEQANQEMTGLEYKADYAPKSRSQSPKKRARDDGVVEDDAAVLSESEESEGESESESESELRGRPRRRLYDYATSSFSSVMRAESRLTSVSRVSGSADRKELGSTRETQLSTVAIEDMDESNDG